VKIFQVTNDVERYQSLLPVKDSVWDRRSTRFHGHPLEAIWKPFDVFALKPLLKEDDFYYFHPGAFIAGPRGRELAATPLEMSGELLPVRCPKKKGEFFVFNVTNCLDVLDEEATEFERPDDPTYKGDIFKCVFHGDRFTEASVFRIARPPVDIFCIERTGDPQDGEFKAMVEANGLEGLEFKLVWSDERRGSKPRKRSLNRIADLSPLKRKEFIVT